MEWTALIFDFVLGFKWVIVALAGMSLFREPLTALLGRVSKVSGGGMNVELKELERSAQETQVAARADQTLSLSEGEIEEIPVVERGLPWRDVPDYQHRDFTDAEAAILRIGQDDPFKEIELLRFECLRAIREANNVFPILGNYVYSLDSAAHALRLMGVEHLSSVIDLSTFTDLLESFDRTSSGLLEPQFRSLTRPTASTFLNSTLSNPTYFYDRFSTIAKGIMKKRRDYFDALLNEVAKNVTQKKIEDPA